MYGTRFRSTENLPRQLTADPAQLAAFIDAWETARASYGEVLRAGVDPSDIELAAPIVRPQNVFGIATPREQGKALWRSIRFIFDIFISRFLQADHALPRDYIAHRSAGLRTATYATSNRPAAPVPPPMHIVITTKRTPAVCPRSAHARSDASQSCRRDAQPKWHRR